MATKLLFADDQLPDDEIADGDVCDVISKRYPHARHGFITAFVKLRGIVLALRDRNYDVTIANTYDKAIRLARDECFDIAIIDLGWSGDHSLEPARQRDAGWAIANQLRESDRSHKRTMPTAQIIYSSRFASNPDIGSQACKDGILPFFKVYSERDSFPIPPPGASFKDMQLSAVRDEANKNSLAAAVGFIDHLLSARSAEMDEALIVLKESRKSLKRWELVAIFCMVASVALIALSVVSVAVFNKPVAIITAVTGAVVAVIPKLLADQIKASRAQLSAGIERVVALGSRGKR